MKKLTTVLLLIIGLASIARAHNNSPAEIGGRGMPSFSVHWDVSDPLAHHNAGSDSESGNMSGNPGHLNLFIG